MAETARIDQFVLEYFYSPITEARIDQYVIEVFTTNTPPLPPPTPLSTTTLQIRRLRRTPTLRDEGQRIFHQRLQIYMQPGIGTIGGQAEDPQMMVRWSDDGGFTWSDEEWISAGIQGTYQAIAQLFNLGAARTRCYEVIVSDPAVGWCLMDAFIDLEKGTH